MARSENTKCIVIDANESYFFSHKIIKKYEAGEVEFVDLNGHMYKPTYFGSGLDGMNGIFVRLEKSVDTGSVLR